MDSVYVPNEIRRIAVDLACGPAEAVAAFACIVAEHCAQVTEAYSEEAAQLIRAEFRINVQRNATF